MSVFRRSRRRQHKLDGGLLFDGPNGTLPSDLVQAAKERRGLAGYGVGDPMQGARDVWRPVAAKVYGTPGGARFGLRARGTLPPAKRVGPWHRLQVRVPEVTLFCQQRRERKEVLFAKGVAGRSGGSPGRRGTYRRRAESQWRC